MQLWGYDLDFILSRLSGSTIAAGMLGILLYLALITVRRLTPQNKTVSTATSYRAITRTVTIGAILTLVGWWLFVSDFSHLYVEQFPVLITLVFAIPLCIAGLSLSAVVAFARKHRAVPHVPTAPTQRRTWITFAPQRWVNGLVFLSVAIMALTLVCGLASSKAEDGTYSILIIRNGQLDAGSTTFFGWAYGIPVTIALALLITATALALASIARPPFRSPAAVASETAIRRAVSKDITQFAVGATILALGQILYFLGATGTGSTGVGIPGVGEFHWSPGYALIAPLLFWIGFIGIAIGLAVLLDSTFRRSQRRIPQQDLSRTTNNHPGISDAQAQLSRSSGAAI